MYLSRLELTWFRNYTRLDLELQACIHIFQGENAQGKTNLLEAIYCLATTKSPLAAHDSQLVSWQAADEVLPYTVIAGHFIREGTEHTFDITIMPEAASPDKTLSGIRKQARYDGIVRRLIDCIGKLNVVLFLPQDVGLIAGSPLERRRYLDVSLCQQSPQYCRHLSRYLKILAQRNVLLRQIREGQASSARLIEWDDQLATEGSFLTAMRIEFIGALADELSELYPSLSGSHETLQLALKTWLHQGILPLAGEHPPSSAHDSDVQATTYKEHFLALLEQNRNEEIAKATTIIGPHRDDLRFLINGNDAAEYGSRGQQRTIVLALKLAEAHYIKHQTQEAPVILLDDIFSELDKQRSHLLLNALGSIEQVLITTTDLNECDPTMVEQASIWRVVNGKVIPLSNAAQS